MTLTERLERKGQVEAEEYENSKWTHFEYEGWHGDPAQTYQAGHSSTHAILVELAAVAKYYADNQPELQFCLSNYKSGNYAKEALANFEKYLGEK